MATSRRIVHQLIAAALVCAAAGCTSTKPFRDASGRTVPGSIASMERVELGGLEQSVWFRGLSRHAPPLILLHGGPGASEAPLFRHYVPELERHFLVVYWEQRGAGRSWRRSLPRDSMTIGRVERDLAELVDYVLLRFGHDRVTLLAHSWGTIPGTRYAYSYPGKVAAYVGIAQIANFAEGERLSLEWALAEAQARGETKAVRALESIAPAPRSVDEELDLGRWVERFGGALRGGLSTRSLIFAALRTDEVGLLDLYRFGAGNRFSLEALRPEYSREDLTRYRHFDVPIVFLLGRHDWHVPAVLAAEYFDQIEAPCKQLVWFEESAHNPPFEQPAAFVDVMVQLVLPLASGAGPVTDRNCAAATGP